MNWFSKLEKKRRYAIVVIPWVLYFIFLITELFALMVVFLVIAAVVSILAAIVHDKEKKAKQTIEVPKNITTISEYTEIKNSFEHEAEANIINFPIYTKVRGTTFEGRQEFLRESEEGDELIIKHSPTQKYPDTIAVINGRTGKQLGNIGADLASSLLDEFGKGCAFYGIIQDITGGDFEHPTLGCNFTIEGIE